MKTPFKKHTSIAVAVAASQFGMVNAVPVFAQPMLEEIVITARKREETLMDAPLSVTAVTGTNMDRQGITNMEQLSASVPGLQIGRGATTNLVSIRGIGSGVNQGFEQSAGMYMDGIYLPKSRQFTQSMVDLQRIEVLRGPQGTLFGKNTIAGAIKVESATSLPGDEFGGSITVDYEPDQDTTRGTVVLSGSPTDTLGARLAVRYQESDGYVDNHTFNRDESADEDTMARLSLAWAPSDSLQIIGKVTYVDQQADGSEVVNSNVDLSFLQAVQAGNSQLGPTSVIGTIAAIAVPGYQASTGSKEYDSWNGNVRYNDGDYLESESTMVSLKFDWQVGDYTITGLTGYTDFDFFYDHDVDFHGGNVAHTVQTEELELISQELRVASEFDGRFNFIAGMYYEEQEYDGINEPTPIDGSLGGVFGQLPASSLVPGAPDLPLSALGINSLWNGTLLAPGTPLAGVELIDIARDTFFFQETDTIAVFGEVSFDLTDSLTLEAGLRYSEDTKEVVKQATLSSGNPSVRAINPDGTPTGSIGPLETALLSTIWGSLLNTYPHDQNLKRDEDHLDPMLRLRWRPNDDTMAYISWSEGYKSGGFNFSPDSANPDGSPGEGTEYEDEQATAWELGVKTTVWDGRARLSGTVFRTEIDDLQVTSFQGLTFKVGNAATMTSQGVELEAQVALTEELEIGGSLMYLDAQYDDFVGGPCTVAQQSAGCPDGQDLSGQTTPYAPKWSGTLYADYSREITDSLRLSLRADINYKDDFFTNGDLDPVSLQDAYTKVNARVALSSIDDRWLVSLYGRNLTDEATYTASLPAPLSAGITAAFIEEPRVVGVQLQYNF